MCVLFVSWQGEMTHNSRSIARNFNAAMEKIGRAIRPKSQSPWVYLLRPWQSSIRASNEKLNQSAKTGRYSVPIPKERAGNNFATWH